jgi:RNA polymerase sigma-70 factor (ECF subfamily)
LLNRVDRRTLELVSRHLDADLSGVERSEVAGILGADRRAAAILAHLDESRRRLARAFQGVGISAETIVRLTQLLRERHSPAALRPALSPEVVGRAAAPFLRDYRLAMQAAEGRDDAWNHIIEIFSPNISTLIYQYGFATEHEDIIQDIFLLLCRRIGTFRGYSSLKTWIFRVAVNFLNNYARRVHAKRSRELQALPDLVADSAAGPEEAFDSQTIRETLHAALATIGEGYRTAVVLRDLHDLSYREIAGILGIPEGTVKSRVARGRMALANVLLAKGIVGH